MKPGTIISDEKSFLKIACSNGLVNILNLQLEGKKRMNIVEFLRGFKISNFAVPVTQQA